MPADSATIPTVINLVLDDYYSKNLTKLGKESLNTILFNKFKVTNPNELNEKQRYDFLITLYNRSRDLFGVNVANSDLERSVRDIISRYGVAKGYFELLEILPQGIFENEKLSLLGREDLEGKVKERTEELLEAKEELEKRVDERTLEIEYEIKKLRVV